MNFEKIEQAYDLLLNNTQQLQHQLRTNIYDAMIEQHAGYVHGEVVDDTISANNKALQQLNLTAEEWRRTFQFLLMKAQQTEPLQYNHQLTPDSIGILISFLVDEWITCDEVTVLELGSGLGNLAYTLEQYSGKTLDYLGIEIDDLLIDLSASMAEVMKSSVHFVQGDAVRPQLLKKSQVIISDLPIGYYSDDVIASRYQVASPTEHTYAHHLLMEQSIKYLSEDGLAIFLAPTNLLTSAQSDLLKDWMKEKVTMVAVIHLPESLFGAKHMGKSVFVLQKKQDCAQETFVYALTNLQDKDEVQDFRKNVKKWSEEHAISSKF